MVPWVGHLSFVLYVLGTFHMGGAPCVSSGGHKVRTWPSWPTSALENSVCLGHEPQTGVSWELSFSVLQGGSVSDCCCPLGG